MYYDDGTLLRESGGAGASIDYRNMGGVAALIYLLDFR